MDGWAWIVVAVAGIGAVGIGGLAVVDLVRGILAAGEAVRKRHEEEKAALQALFDARGQEVAALQGRVECLCQALSGSESELAEAKTKAQTGDRPGQVFTSTASGAAVNLPPIGESKDATRADAAPSMPNGEAPCQPGTPECVTKILSEAASQPPIRPVARAKLRTKVARRPAQGPAPAIRLPTPAEAQAGLVAATVGLAVVAVVLAVSVATAQRPPRAHP